MSFAWLLWLAMAARAAAAPDVSALSRALNDPDPKARAEAVAVLASYGPQVKAALPDLLALFGRAPDQERASLVLPLLSVSGADAPVCDALVAAMSGDPSPAVRVQAIRYAGARCPKAAPALPPLLRDADASFMSCFTPRGLPARKPVCERVNAAADALGHAAFTSQDKARLAETLVQGLDDKDPGFRRACLQALRQVPAPKTALPRLTRVLKTGTPLERRAALQALAAAGPSDHELAAMAGVAEADPRPWLRDLARLEVDHAQSAPAFFTLRLQSRSKSEQLEAARWLAGLAFAAPQALPILRRLSGSSDAGLRAAARQADTAIREKQALEAAAAADPD